MDESKIHDKLAAIHTRLDRLWELTEDLTHNINEWMDFKVCSLNECISVIEDLKNSEDLVSAVSRIHTNLNTLLTDRGFKSCVLVDINTLSMLKREKEDLLNREQELFKELSKNETL